MKEIVYTAHLEVRMKLRGIPHELPVEIYRTAEERYFDRETEKIVAVAPVKHKGRTRELMLAYQETDTAAHLVTIHPLKKDQKISRIKSGRWQKL